jgi:hypothetical protein
MPLSSITHEQNCIIANFIIIYFVTIDTKIDVFKISFKTTKISTH